MLVEAVLCASLSTEIDRVGRTRCVTHQMGIPREKDARESATPSKKVARATNTQGLPDTAQPSLDRDSLRIGASRNDEITARPRDT
jgi:hypothetical protein